MSDLYKLVFRGEVLEGQHPAVVRKRLGQAVDFSEDALEKLFSGRPVVLKREADTATAAKLQMLFKKAGARLRVLPVERDDHMAPAAPARETPGPSEDDLQLLPAGSDVLRDDERPAWEPREVDTGDLALDGARFAVPEADVAPAGPDVSHLTLTEAGTDLGPQRKAPERPVQAPDLELAETGADLAPRRADSTPVVDFAELTFEVAPAGSDLGQRRVPPPPEAPDTSHLDLAEPDRSGG